MANVTSVTDGFFVTAQEGFVTTTGGSVSAGASTVPLNSVAGYSDGDYVALVVDPTDATKKQVFTGEIDTAGNQVINVEWTEGDDVSHSAGATVVDYETATAWALYAKGMRVSHETDGALKEQAVKDALGITGSTPPDYNTIATLPTTMTYNGNRSYDVVFPGVDLTSTLHPGSRLRFTRSTNAPTQCTSLNGTNQYYSKSSPAAMTFTDDFVVSAWVKYTNYQNATIIGRFDGNNGWQLSIGADGRPILAGYAGSAGGNYSQVISYQSVPLNKWVHITAQLDMSSFTATSTTSYMMFDGVDIPVAVQRGGTNPTALVQAGDLNIGRLPSAGTQFFPGKIAQAAVFNSKVTQATMRGYISQGLVGTETSLISAYSFNNSINDLNTTNANNLTANGSAVATNADSPFGIQSNGTISSTVDYGIVQKATFSTNTTATVQVPEGNTITTSGAISAVSYSDMKAPYGIPIQKSKWRVSYIVGSQLSKASSSGAWTDITGVKLTVPIGEWVPGYQMPIQVNPSPSSTVGPRATMSRTAAAESDKALSVSMDFGATTASAGYFVSREHSEGSVTLAAATDYYFNMFAGAGTHFLRGDTSQGIMYADNAYL